MEEILTSVGWGLTARANNCEPFYLPTLDPLAVSSWSPTAATSGLSPVYRAGAGLCTLAWSSSMANADIAAGRRS
jgi:hypothetical protein